MRARLAARLCSLADFVPPCRRRAQLRVHLENEVVFKKPLAAAKKEEMKALAQVRAARSGAEGEGAPRRSTLAESAMHMLLPLFPPPQELLDAMDAQPAGAGGDAAGAAKEPAPATATPADGGAAAAGAAATEGGDQ